MKKLILIVVICVITLSYYVPMGFKKSDKVYALHNTASRDLCSAYLENDLFDEEEYSSNITSYDNFMEVYFDNLTQNLGMNYKGSCGYVAIGMMLSYYDTFFDDSIIPEQYDVISNGSETNMIQRRNSPGILRDVLEVPEGETASYWYNASALEYFNQISSIVNLSLHAKLISIGESLGYYDYESIDKAASTTFDIRKDVIDNYLTDFIGLTSTDYTLSYLNFENALWKSGTVRAYVIDQIQNGNPVLLSIETQFHDAGHVVVAYDYDAVTDMIYCHFGWGAGTTHVTIEAQNFYYYKSALVINFNGEHEHSNNYAVTAEGAETTYYCHDSEDIITYCDHENANSYEIINSLSHFVICECGFEGAETHNIICVYIDNLTHRNKCLPCNYSSNTPHVFMTTDLTYCVGCNTRITEPGIGEIIHPGWVAQMVTANGSYILPNGCIVLVSEDVAAYFSGTLVFYDASNPPQTA